MKKMIVTLFVMAMVLSIGCGDSTLLKNDDDVSQNTQIIENSDPLKNGPYSVVRVVDGDTIIVNVDGTDEKIRLIGIDTPESVHPDKNKNVPYGKVASGFTRNLLTDQEVWLEYDVQPRDQYGRVLAYVYLGEKMINQTLLQEGHAKVATFPPNVKYVDEFKKLQETARVEEKGIWGTNPLANLEQETENKEVSLVGNKNTKVLHLSECNSVRQMSEKNKVIFHDKETPIKEGYEPCNRCNP